MRINCPLCGERGVEEFIYQGDAAPRRPDAGAETADWVEYAFLRDNPAGAHEELWYHQAGCHAWLVVTRELRTHRVLGARMAREVAEARVGGDAR